MPSIPWSSGLRVVTIIAWIISLMWLIKIWDSGEVPYEPAITFLTGMGALIASFVVQDSRISLSSKNTVAENGGIAIGSTSDSKICINGSQDEENSTVRQPSQPGQGNPPSRKSDPSFTSKEDVSLSSENTSARNGGVSVGTAHNCQITVQNLSTSSFEVVPHQIYAPPADFTGREKEVEELLDHFERGAVIAGVRGMGGIGKTALAYKLAEKLRDQYPDGQLMVSLQGTDMNIAKPLKPAEAMAHVIRSLNQTVDLPENESDLAGLYQSVLHGKRVLILLDNALDDHQVRPLLPPPTCGVLVTSRKKFTLPGLKEMDLNTLKPQEARDLLLAIAGRIGDKADELARLCGYLPLALRAAGSLLANTPDLDPAQYIEELRAERTRLERLGSEGVDLDVEASFNLSYGRLSEDTARVFRALSVFPADFDANAEEVVCGDEGHRHLSELVRWCLMEFQEGIIRYRLHDLARVFAAARLDMIDGEAARANIELTHAQYYKDMLSEADDLYRQGGEGVLAGLELFDLEWANILAGQMYVESILTQVNIVEKSPMKELALRLSSTYPDAGTYVLDMRLHPHEQIRWRKTALTSACLLNDQAAEGQHLGILGVIYEGLGEYHKAIEFHEKALAIAKKLGYRLGEGAILGNLGLAYDSLGDYPKAIELHERALAIAKESSARRVEETALDNLGIVYKNLGEYRKAIRFYEKALAIARERGDRQGEGKTLGNLGNTYLELGDYQKAIVYYEHHLAIAREIGDRRGEGNTQGSLGTAYSDLGNYPKAIEYYEHHLAIAKEIGDRRGEGNALGNLGNVYYRLGDYRKAIEYNEQHLAIAREIGDLQGEGNVLWNMSLALDKTGDRVRAIGNAKSALDIYEQIESPYTERARKKLAEWQR